MFYNIFKNKKIILIFAIIFTIFHIGIFLLDNQIIILLLVLFIVIIELTLLSFLYKRKNKL